MPAVRNIAMALLLVLLLSGCTSAGREAVTAPPINDIPVLPPEEVEPIEFIEPAKGLAQVEVRGRVLDQAGAPIKGVLLWVEGADLREPINNIDAYVERRSETLLRTGADGTYRFVLDEGLFALIASAPGYYQHRFQPSLDRAVVEHDVLMRKDEIKLIGHRGASYYAPENTEAGLIKAKWLGIDMVELDVRVTRDNVLIAMHDRNLLRTTGHDAFVDQTPYKTIKGLDAGAWFGPDYAGQKVPTLDDMFAWAEEHGVQLLLDVKVPADDQVARVRTWEGTLDAIESWGFEDRALFGSFHREGAQRCVQRQTIQCSWLVSDPAQQRTAVNTARTLGVKTLMVSSDIADSLLVQEAGKAGIAVQVWGMNTEEDWAAMLAIGVKQWNTDRPGYIQEFLNTR